MRYLVCMLEEPSAEEMLRAVLPKILPDDIVVQYVVFEGKQDLEKRLEKRLRGWQSPDSVFLVMRDQDAGDCHLVKETLNEKVVQSGKVDQTLIRIACHELESFYLGDLQAVEQGLGLNNLVKLQNKRKYRTPDHLGNAAEELYRLTNRRYQKLQGSRDIAPHLNLDAANRSHSFNVLISGLKNLVAAV